MESYVDILLIDSKILLAEVIEDLALGEIGLDRMWSEGLLTT